MNDVLELLRSEPALWIGIAVLLGLMIGSFLNVVVHRLPKMMEREWGAQCAELAGTEPEPQPAFNLAQPRSHCPSCRAPITALQNLPVLSWFALFGPAKLPADIANRLASEITLVVDMPAVKQRIAVVGADPSPMTPAAFTRYVDDENRKWAKIVRAAKVPLQD